MEIHTGCESSTTGTMEWFNFSQLLQWRRMLYQCLWWWYFSLLYLLFQKKNWLIHLISLTLMNYIVLHTMYLVLQLWNWYDKSTISYMVNTKILYMNYCFPDKQKHISTLVVDEINTMMIYFTPKTFLQNLTVHAYVT